MPVSQCDKANAFHALDQRPGARGNGAIRRDPATGVLETDGDPRRPTYALAY